MTTINQLGASWALLAELFLRREREWTNIGEQLGLTPPTMRALMTLQEDPDMLMRDLAFALGCHPSYVTALISRLEELGYIDRRASPTDGRTRLLVLTESGRAATATITEALFQPPREILDLDASKQQLLVDLATAIDEQLSPTSNDSAVDR